MTAESKRKESSQALVEVVGIEDKFRVCRFGLNFRSLSVDDEDWEMGSDPHPGRTTFTGSCPIYHTLTMTWNSSQKVDTNKTNPKIVYFISTNFSLLFCNVNLISEKVSQNVHESMHSSVHFVNHLESINKFYNLNYWLTY